ncbi:MAG: hypothetical protein PHV63_04410 [Candidatus Daviesbacteria bacterium]|nr:hypothetical protein [Candidatus Daviesbacteria bacterium]
MESRGSTGEDLLHEGGSSSNVDKLGARLQRLQVFGRPVLDFVGSNVGHAAEFGAGMAASIGAKAVARELLTQIWVGAATGVVGRIAVGGTAGFVVGAGREYVKQARRSWKEVAEHNAGIKQRIRDLETGGGSSEEARELARQKRSIIGRFQPTDRVVIVKAGLKGAAFGALGGAVAEVVSEMWEAGQLDWLKELPGNIGRGVGDTMGGIGRAGGEVAGNIGKTVGDAAGSAGETIGSTAGEAGKNIGDTLGETGRAGENILGEAKETARKNIPGAAGAGNALGRAGQAINQTTGDLIGKIDEWTAPLPGGAVEGVTSNPPDILADAASQIHDVNLSPEEVVDGLRKETAAAVGEHLGDIDNVTLEAILAHGMDPSQLSAEQFEQVRYAVQQAAEAQANDVFTDAAAQHSDSLAEAVSSGHDQYGQVLEKSHDQLLESAKGTLDEVLQAEETVRLEIPADSQHSIVQTLREAAAKGKVVEIGGHQFSSEQINALAKVFEGHIDQLADTSAVAIEAHATEVLNSLGGFIPLEVGSNPWEVSTKILKDVLGETPSPQQIMELDKIICQQNGISVPSWGIPGSIDHRALPVGFPIKIDDTIKNAVLAMVKK